MSMAQFKPGNAHGINLNESFMQKLMSWVRSADGIGTVKYDDTGNGSVVGMVTNNTNASRCTIQGGYRPRRVSVSFYEQLSAAAAQKRPTLSTTHGSDSEDETRASTSTGRSVDTPVRKEEAKKDKSEKEKPKEKQKVEAMLMKTAAAPIPAVASTSTSSSASTQQAEQVAQKKEHEKEVDFQVHLRWSFSIF